MGPAVVISHSTFLPFKKMIALRMSVVVIFVGLFALSECAPNFLEERSDAVAELLDLANPEPHDRCGNAYSGCCDCSRRKNKGMIVASKNWCKPGFKCACVDDRIGFGFGYCSGQCKK